MTEELSMKIHRFLFSTFLSFAISSCGGKAELLDIPALPGAGLSLLYGTWSAPCYSGIVQQHLFSGGNFTHTTTVYNEVGCNTVYYTLEVKGTYAASVTYQPSSGDEGPIDKTFYTITMTPASTNSAASMNVASFCGLGGWSSGVARSVSGLTCGGTAMFTAGQIRYDQFHYSTVTAGIQTAGDLWFSYPQPGSPVDGSTEAKRTIVFDGNFDFRK